MREVGGYWLSRVVNRRRRSIRECGRGVGQREALANAAEEVELSEPGKLHALRSGVHADPVTRIEHATKLTVHTHRDLARPLEHSDPDAFISRSENETPVEGHMRRDGGEDQRIEVRRHDGAACSKAVSRRSR